SPSPSTAGAGSSRRTPAVRRESTTSKSRLRSSHKSASRERPAAQTLRWMRHKRLHLPDKRRTTPGLDPRRESRRTSNPAPSALRDLAYRLRILRREQQDPLPRRSAYAEQIRARSGGV